MAPNAKQVIATKTVVVKNDALGIHQRVFAGQPVPPDLVSAYNAEVDEADEVRAPSSASVSRVEPTTAPPPQTENEKTDGDDGGDAPSIDDPSLKREQLDLVALELGVEDPDKLNNKGEVRDAIKEHDDDKVAAALAAVLAE